MPTSIHARVRLAQQGQLPSVVIKLKSGWVIMSDFQPVTGYCLLLPDPVVKDLNALSEAQRIQYSLDTILVGDALLAVTNCYRINYEIWGNVDPALHTHIVPRYLTEPEDQRKLPICKAYQYEKEAKFNPDIHYELVQNLRNFLQTHI